mgnify:CR=1 FL=1
MINMTRILMSNQILVLVLEERDTNLLEVVVQEEVSFKMLTQNLILIKMSFKKIEKIYYQERLKLKKKNMPIKFK